MKALAIKPSPEKLKIKPPTLTFYQEEWARIEQRFLIIEASTKVGKTAFMMWLIFVLSQITEANYHKCSYAHKRVVKEGDNFWWIAPTYQQAKIVLDRLWRKIGKHPGYRKNESQLYIRTPVGTYIWFKTADKPDNLYGEDVIGAVFDEFTRGKPDAWYALRSTLTATNGWCKFIGNYKGQGNWGHQLAMNAEKNPKVYAYRVVNAWKAVEAGILQREEIEQAKQDLPAFMFKALYLCEGSIDKARWVEDDKIENLPTNYHVIDQPNRKKYISADIALQGSDKFTIWVWLGKELIHLEVVLESNGKEVVETLERIRRKYGVPASNVVYDADGIGRALGGYLQGYKEFFNGAQPHKQRRKHKYDFANQKAQCYWHFAQEVNAGNYLIRKELLDQYWGEFVEELEVIKNRNYEKEGKLAVLKKEEIRGIIMRSPDFTDGAMMREYFEVAGKHKPVIA